MFAIIAEGQYTQKIVCKIHETEADARADLGKHFLPSHDGSNFYSLVKNGDSIIDLCGSDELRQMTKHLFTHFEDGNNPLIGFSIREIKFGDKLVGWDFD